jgi:hypothetical protein
MGTIIRQGIITQGKYKDWKVAIQDDKEDTGGFFVLVQSGTECYDSWVPDQEALERYLQEAGWAVSWDE